MNTDAAMSNDSAKPVIMVVDDTPANLRLLEEVLSPVGYDVRPFPRGTLALSAVPHVKPDLILLDIMMPMMDGYEVCKELKANEESRHIPVIFLSAKAETVDKVAAFATGAVDYVTKPFKVEELKVRVETHLTMRRLQQELEWHNGELNTTLSELKAAQARLVQSEKMAAIGVLTAGIAHEINNPINFIQASAKAVGNIFGELANLLTAYEKATQEGDAAAMEAIRKELQVEVGESLEGGQELTKNLTEGANRVAEIVRGLRTFSRLDDMDRKPSDLHNNLRSTVALLGHELGTSIKVEEVFGELEPVLCFPGKINQVFMNLVKNAVDAIKENGGESAEGTITVRTEEISRNGERWAKVEVDDDGPGIPEQVIAKLFDPFFTTKDVGAGTGLGLAISQSIVADHGGELVAKNRPEGGASFSVLLPMDGMQE